MLASFIAQAADSLGKRPPEAPPELLNLLSNYHFPGNVRELRAMVYDSVARHKSGRILGIKGFRKTIGNNVAKTPKEKKHTEVFGVEGKFPTLKEAQRLHIEEAMRRAGGNQGTAAAMLGISGPALNRRLVRM